MDNIFKCGVQGYSPRLEHLKIWYRSNSMAGAYGAAGMAMATPLLSLHGNTLMLLYKSARVTPWHKDRYTLIEQSNAVIKHSV